MENQQERHYNKKKEDRHIQQERHYNNVKRRDTFNKRDIITM